MYAGLGRLLIETGRFMFLVALFVGLVSVVFWTALLHPFRRRTIGTQLRLGGMYGGNARAGVANAGGQGSVDVAVGGDDQVVEENTTVLPPVASEDRNEPPRIASLHTYDQRRISRRIPALGAFGTPFHQGGSIDTLLSVQPPLVLQHYKRTDILEPSWPRVENDEVPDDFSTPNTSMASSDEE